MPGLRAMRGARARARPGRGAAACAPGSPAPRSFRRGRRQRRDRRSLSGRCRRRRSASSWPASPPFSPSWRGRAEPSRGRGGAGRGEEEAEDGEKEEERRALPPPGCRRSLTSALKSDPESGARDCITDYIRLSRASRSQHERGARAGAGVWRERWRGGGAGKGKRTHTRASGKPGARPMQQQHSGVGSQLSASPGSRGVLPRADHWAKVDGRVGGWAGRADGWREGSCGRACAPTE